MKNKLISQKTRSRASKVVLALFLCTIMISSLCSFTVGNTFTLAEAPVYDYQTYEKLDGESDAAFAERIYSLGAFECATEANDVLNSSVYFYYLDELYVAAVSYGEYLLYAYEDLYSVYAGQQFTLVNYSQNDYTTDFLEVLFMNPTESLTNVWDGILNWITTSISSLQNVFWQEGTVIDFNSDVDTSDAITINDTVLYKCPINYTELSPDSVAIVDGNVIDNEDGSVEVVTVDNVAYACFLYDGTVLYALYRDNPDHGVFTNIDADYYFVDSSGGSLTLLGTLCCIAVAISVVFLLIGTIVNFLKLRS